MKTILLSLSILILSCSTQKTETTMEKKSFEQLNSEGFVEMRIIQEKNSKCTFVLKSKDGNTYEVEGIESKIPNIKANTNIYVKFSPSRRTSQCNGQPITIEEIQIL